MTTTRTEYDGWTIVTRTGTYQMASGEVRQAKLTTRITDGSEWFEGVHTLTPAGRWIYAVSGCRDRFTPDAERTDHDGNPISQDSINADHAEALTLNAKVSSFPFPRIDITYNHGNWTLTTAETLTDEQAGALTFRAEPEQVWMSAFVEVVDAGGVRIGHLASATYHRGSYFRPDYITCTIELT